MRESGEQTLFVVLEASGTGGLSYESGESFG